MGQEAKLVPIFTLCCPKGLSFLMDAFAIGPHCRPRFGSPDVCYRSKTRTRSDRLAAPPFGRPRSSRRRMRQRPEPPEPASPPVRVTIVAAVCVCLARASVRSRPGARSMMGFGKSGRPSLQRVLDPPPGHCPSPCYPRSCRRAKAPAGCASSTTSISHPPRRCRPMPTRRAAPVTSRLSPISRIRRWF